MLSNYFTKLGIKVSLETEILDYQQGIDFILDKIDFQHGALFSSSFEYPGRYTCWDVGFYNPPLLIKAKDNIISMHSLNQRGEILLSMLKNSFLELNQLKVFDSSAKHISMNVVESTISFSEEERSKQPSVFSAIRHLIDCFYSQQEHDLGLYGAYAYDLIFQFEKLKKVQPREAQAQDLIVYLPDELYIVNHRKEESICKRYDFSYLDFDTKGFKRAGKTYQTKLKTKLKTNLKTACDHKVGEYSQTVLKAKEKFAKGDLFEVVPSQTFYEECDELPSVLFKRLRKTNPAPYGFCIHLEYEHLIGASPEMYVRLNEKRVETCPISGTIKRGKNAIEDAQQIAKLLNSEKECAELTMCTDVDRNDKSRVCYPGTVKVIGRRQIEMYSRLIHTVDHVEGILKDGFDSVDAFLSHMWVVTVTGAPKLWAMKFIEENEHSARRWYAGAVGWFGFDGNLNTGLTLRTIRYSKGVAEVRAGATLLYDSVPEAEEQETHLKGSALLDVIRNKTTNIYDSYNVKQSGIGRRVFIVDNDDSFVHTLANYFRQTGAEVITYRHDFSWHDFDKLNIDLVVLSPGPGSPKDFNLNETINQILKRKLPIFGVCLGLQAIVEYFGGNLLQLEEPVHGKSDLINTCGGKLFSQIEQSFTAGRYHSLYADAATWPKSLEISAKTQDGIIMAIEDKLDSIYAVQFHPETILSQENNVGIKIIEQVMLLTNHK